MELALDGLDAGDADHVAAAAAFVRAGGRAVTVASAAAAAAPLAAAAAEAARQGGGQLRVTARVAPDAYAAVADAVAAVRAAAAGAPVDVLLAHPERAAAAAGPAIAAALAAPFAALEQLHRAGAVRAYGVESRALRLPPAHPAHLGLAALAAAAGAAAAMRLLAYPASVLDARAARPLRLAARERGWRCLAVRPLRPRAADGDRHYLHIFAADPDPAQAAAELKRALDALIHVERAAPAVPRDSPMGPLPAHAFSWGHLIAHSGAAQLSTYAELDAAVDERIRPVLNAAAAALLPHRVHTAWLAEYRARFEDAVDALKLARAMQSNRALRRLCAATLAEFYPLGSDADFSRVCVAAVLDLGAADDVAVTMRSEEHVRDLLRPIDLRPPAADERAAWADTAESYFH